LATENAAFSGENALDLQPTAWIWRKRAASAENGLYLEKTRRCLEKTGWMASRRLVSVANGLYLEKTRCIRGQRAAAGENALNL
jgi:hypothetical protein